MAVVGSSPARPVSGGSNSARIAVSRVSLVPGYYCSGCLSIDWRKNARLVLQALTIWTLRFRPVEGDEGMMIHGTRGQAHDRLCAQGRERLLECKPPQQHLSHGIPSAETSGE